MNEYVQWSNLAHQHSGIGLQAPSNVHYGLADSMAVMCSQTLALAGAQDPEQCSTANDPSLLALPAAVWINNPQGKAVQAV
ncbi:MULTISPECIES: hypothetical protein [unclassified Arthrobacter]|uniref:hypothetical protein n=1 Tax=unclassified Arthrobacter TaxID=235627 RepID=UPI0011B0954F|nr:MULTISPECIES: hypothetical protein [unclassified Arthrobacter]